MLLVFSILSCNRSDDTTDNTEETTANSTGMTTYTPFALTTDVSSLEDYEKEMIPHLINAARIMDLLFWDQAYGNGDSLLKTIEDEDLKNFARINYGPWDRLDGDKAFIEGYGEKPLGANIYPADMTKEEFEGSGLPEEEVIDLYSMVRRDEMGKLYTIPYHEYYRNHLQGAADHLRKAAEVCKNAELKEYLELRADALLSDRFDASDIAWLKMKTNGLDIIIGPIENYEDKLYNYRTAYEAYVLVKDKAWSKKLEKYVSYLPELQSSLPVDDKYKSEVPGNDGTQLNAYDVIYYAGDCNAGSKTIAVNLPNDEELQVNYGTRRSQLKNAMQAKFDKILLPISEVLISEDQRHHITFNAFFSNTMFHEGGPRLGNQADHQRQWLCTRSIR